jgi:hypothetical protein
MDDLFVPPDNQATKQGKREKGFYGVCGPSTIAVLARRSVKEIIDLWPGGYKGYGPLKEMQAILAKLGYSAVRVKGNKARVFPTPATRRAIVRIQWLKPDGTEYYWKAQTPNTHYVLIYFWKGEWWIFCNEFLWFKKNSLQAKDYLKLGYVSSYLEIRKQNWPTLGGDN